MESGFVEYPFDEAPRGGDPLLAGSYSEAEYYRQAEVGKRMVDEWEAAHPEESSQSSQDSDPAEV